MNKRRFFWSIGLLVLGAAFTLLVFVVKPKTQAAGTSQESSPVRVSRPAVYSGQPARFSGDDLYDPSINPSLLATQQACGSVTQRHAGNQPAVDLQCVPHESAIDGIPAGSSFSGDDLYDPAAGGLSR